MTAVLIPTASEQEWLEARCQGVTASEIAVVMGLSPWSSPYALYHRKLGNLPEQDDSAAMALGRYLEQYVGDRFAERFPHLVPGNRDKRYLFSHPKRPWQLATPDALIREIGCGLDPVAVLECKTDASYDGWGDDGSDEIPVHYRAQVLWQMDVLGVTAGYAACLFLHSRQVRVYELQMDAQALEDLELMRAEGRLFLTRVERGDPPGVDWRPATADALKRLHPSIEDKEAVVGVRTAISYRAAIRRYREAERRKHEMTNRLRAEMGSAIRAVTWRGEAVATRQAYDVKEHARKASHVDKIVPAKPPREKP